MPLTRSRLVLALGGIALIAVSGAWAATTEIDQVGQRFSRSSITLAVGDALHFINQDDVRHNIRIVDAEGHETDKGLQDPGQMIDAQFDKAGHYTARCAIHQKMKLAIEVK